MNLEDTKLCEIIQEQRTNCAGFHVYEIPRAVRFTETEGGMVVTRGHGAGGKGSCYLMSVV